MSPPAAGATGHPLALLTRTRRVRGRDGPARQRPGPPGHDAAGSVRRRPDPRAGTGAADHAASPFRTDPTVSSIGFQDALPGFAARSCGRPARRCAAERIAAGTLLDRRDTFHALRGPPAGQTTLTLTAPGQIPPLVDGVTCCRDGDHRARGTRCTLSVTAVDGGSQTGVQTVPGPRGRQAYSVRWAVQRRLERGQLLRLVAGRSHARTPSGPCLLDLVTW